MASVYPAMRGKFGTTEYYMITMKAGDVSHQLVIPKEMEGWDELELEERFQREVNYNRVKKHIAPYLVQDDDRFFGALIVAIMNPDSLVFEDLKNVVSDKVPALYQSASRAFGFLTLSGEEVMVPLDGQHRLAAIKFALTGKDEKQKNIEDLEPNNEIAKDDVLLILIKHEPVKARKIFNKVNRYAKATSKADNLITADDDIIAIISRELVANELIGSRVVNYQSNTLPDSSIFFTTLSTIYESNKRILEEIHGKINDQVLPDKQHQTLYKDNIKEVWDHLLKGVEIFRTALSDVEEAGDEKRKEMRKTMILAKPLAQQALIIAVSRLRSNETSSGSKLSWDEILKRINSVDWSVDNTAWQKILMNGTKIVSGRQATLFAGRFIAYYLGEKLENNEIKQLTEQYLNAFPEAEKSKQKLPKPSFNP
ncbi:MAG: DNA sulfur modification protein DndB [Gammaproteobacteria bacterium]